MRGPAKKRFTLMPLIAIAGLSLVVTLRPFPPPSCTPPNR